MHVLFDLSPGAGRPYYDDQFEIKTMDVNSRDTSRMDLPAWQARLQRFSAERGWEPFQNPKNLVMALSVEAAELVECYQWLTPEEAAAPSPALRQAVAEEMADVLAYLLQLSRVTGIELEPALEAKLAKTALKYPAP